MRDAHLRLGSVVHKGLSPRERGVLPGALDHQGAGEGWVFPKQPSTFTSSTVNIGQACRKT